MINEYNRIGKLGYEKNASDIHITVGIPPALRINGQLIILIKKIKAR